MYVCISTFFLDMRETLKSEIVTYINQKGFSYTQLTVPSSLDLSSGIAVLGTWKQNQRAFPLYIFKNKVFWNHCIACFGFYNMSTSENTVYNWMLMRKPTNSITQYHGYSIFHWKNNFIFLLLQLSHSFFYHTTDRRKSRINNF